MTDPTPDTPAPDNRPQPVVEKRVPVAAGPESASTAGLYETPPEPEVPQGPAAADPPPPAAQAPAIASEPEAEPEPPRPGEPLAQAHEPLVEPDEAAPQALQESAPLSIPERMVSLQVENQRLRAAIDQLEHDLKKALS